MSSDEFFALPAFKPEQALLQLKRQLRDCKGLAERGSSFELSGQEVVKLAADDSVITVHLAKRPARSPEWQVHQLKNGADVRRFVDTVKAQLARWSDE